MEHINFEVDDKDGIFSRAERKVLPFLGTELKQPEIAGRLCLSNETVKSHLKHIGWKLNVSGRVSMFAKLVAMGTVFFVWFVFCG